MIDPATVTWRHKQFYSFNDSPCRVVGIRRSMAKAKTVYVCQECGGVSAKWQGQCPHCQAWNTMVETVERGNAPTAPNRYAHLAEAAPVRNLADIEARDTPRQPTGLSEFDRVLGGGLRSEEHTSELQSRENLVCRLLLEKKKAATEQP